MTFTIVDIPVGPVVATPNSPIIEALQKNIGKAISVPLEGKDANNYRKTLRASLSTRGILKKYLFRSRVGDKDNLIVWLEEIPGQGVTQDGTTPERMRG